MRRYLYATVASLVLTQAAGAAELSAANQAKLLANVEAYVPRMSEVALQIWAMPELGYQETKTTALLQGELKKAGFTIQTGVAEMPTAFVAKAGTNDGPVIAILPEMDSLPRIVHARRSRPQAACRRGVGPCLRAQSVRFGRGRRRH